MELREETMIQKINTIVDYEYQHKNETFKNKINLLNLTPALIADILNNQKLPINITATLLERGESCIHKLFKNKKIKSYKDEDNKSYTTKGDIEEYLQTKVPVGWKVVQAIGTAEMP